MEFWRPPAGGGYIHIGEMFPLGGPLPPVGVPEGALLLFHPSDLFRSFQPGAGQLLTHVLLRIGRGREEVGWSLLRFRGSCSVVSCCKITERMGFEPTNAVKTLPVFEFSPVFCGWLRLVRSARHS